MQLYCKKLIASICNPLEIEDTPSAPVPSIMPVRPTRNHRVSIMNILLYFLNIYKEETREQCFHGNYEWSRHRNRIWEQFKRVTWDAFQDKKSMSSPTHGIHNCGLSYSTIMIVLNTKNCRVFCMEMSHPKVNCFHMVVKRKITWPIVVWDESIMSLNSTTNIIKYPNKKYIFISAKEWEEVIQQRLMLNFTKVHLRHTKCKENHP